MFNFIETNVMPYTDWNTHIVQMEKQISLVSDVLATMFNDDVGIDVEHMSSITPPSSQTWELGSFPWSNFPSVC